MGSLNFHKEKVQVVYTTKLDLKSSDKSLSNFAEAPKLIKVIEKGTDDWAFDFKISVKVDKKKGPQASIDRVTSITYPRVRNGHQGEDGHDWQWQLDTESMGKGSKDRLYLDGVKAEVGKVKQDGTVKVGKEEYVKVTCEVTVTGSFAADTKH